jgi:hypothetical protein
MAIDKDGKIILDTVLIDHENIIVLGSSTAFASQKFVEKINAINLSAKIKEIGQIAKLKSVKFTGKNKALKLSRDNQESYEREFSLYIDLFNNLRTLAKAKVEKGIFPPTADDLEINKMYEIRNQIHAMFHGGKPMSIIRDLNNRVDDILDRIKTSDTLISVNLG